MTRSAPAFVPGGPDRDDPMIRASLRKLRPSELMIRASLRKLRRSWSVGGGGDGGARKRSWLVPVVVTAALALAGCGNGAEGDDQVAGQLVQFAVDKRVAAPEVKGQLLDGGSFELAALKGSIVVINFWASWCAPCRLEVADLEMAHKELTDVKFVGFNTYDDKDKALAFMDGKATYPSVLDTSGKLALAFRQVPPNTLPATIIVDADGKIAAVIRRTTTKEELTGLVNIIAAERG